MPSGASGAFTRGEATSRRLQQAVIPQADVEERHDGAAPKPRRRLVSASRALTALGLVLFAAASLAAIRPPRVASMGAVEGVDGGTVVYAGASGGGSGSDGGGGGGSDGGGGGGDDGGGGDGSGGCGGGG